MAAAVDLKRPTDKGEQIPDVPEGSEPGAR